MSIFWPTVDIHNVQVQICIMSVKKVDDCGGGGTGSISSARSGHPEIIFSQLDDNTVRNDVVASTVVCEQEHSQTDRKEERQ